MDEESPKKKISVNNFFERVDSVEKVANSSLSKVNSVTAVANANKLLIESLQLSVEAIQTDIRDIANYIIIDHKLEKDLKEDRLLEEQDAQQKKDISEKLLGLKGPQGPQGPQGQQGIRGEDFGSKGGGGSFLGGLLKGLLTLGATGFALKVMWPALLPVVKGALGSAVGGGIKFLGGAVGKTLIGILGGIPLIGAAAKLIGGGIQKTANKAGDGLEKTIKNMGEDGKINIPTSAGEGGGEKIPKEIDKKVEPEKIPKEIDKKVEPEKKETKFSEFAKKGGVAGFLNRRLFGNKKDEEDEEKKSKGERVTYKDGSKTITIDKGGYLDSLSKGDAIQKFTELNDRRIKSELAAKKGDKSLELKSREKRMLRSLGIILEGKFDVNTRGIRSNVGLEIKGKTDDMGLIEVDPKLDFPENPYAKPIIESKDVGSLEIPDKVEMGNSTNVTETTIPPTAPPVNNPTPLVQANPPQISDVSIKPTEANIPFRKLISSKKYLSVSDMNKSGLPPEIAKML